VSDFEVGVQAVNFYQTARRHIPEGSYPRIVVYRYLMFYSFKGYTCFLSGVKVF
jgi:hypothetical protein